MPTSKNHGLKGGVSYVMSQLPQRSLTKQALKRLATALKRKPSAGRQTSCSSQHDDCADHVNKPLSSHIQTSFKDCRDDSTVPEHRVSFCDKVNVRITIGRHELSQKEHTQAWYSESEFLEMANDCFNIVEKLRREKSTKCPRGLERMTRIGKMQAAENRRNAVNLVLDEQDRQAMEGVYDDDYTAYLYHSISSSCHLWSAVVGLHDQKEAALE
eukprot:Nitzschia sp. Nitz4//scaffold42_size132992//21014//21655//NITZ4_003382-RA/size132992-processed-gene-0.3-mRNA-1//1//CDS//3329551667//909//frame0